MQGDAGMKACLLGSIGVVVETSRLQRLAYNAAFEELGLDVYWNVATYCKVLEIPGGLRRLEAVFGDRWPVGMAEEVHSLKHRHFERLAQDGLELRPGVAETIAYCRGAGIRLGWATTTTPEMLDIIVRHTAGLDHSVFELVCSKDDVTAEKPDPSVYLHALASMDLTAADVIAVEDTPANQVAALAAELQCYLYPGEYALADNSVLLTRNLPDTVRRAHELWAGMGSSVGSDTDAALAAEPG